MPTQNRTDRKPPGDPQHPTQGKGRGMGPAVEEARQLLMQCPHPHSHANRTLGSLETVDRPSLSTPLKGVHLLNGHPQPCPKLSLPPSGVRSPLGHPTGYTVDAPVGNGHLEHCLLHGIQPGKQTPSGPTCTPLSVLGYALPPLGAPTPVHGVVLPPRTVLGPKLQKGHSRSSAIPPRLRG